MLDLKRKALSLIGSGIKSVSHLTIEAQAYIKQADIVLYLVNEPIIEEWLQRNSRKFLSLENIYFSCAYREDSYKQIVQEILSQFSYHNNVSVVLYGHPTVFAHPGLKAIQVLEEAGGEVAILPGISAEDCLFVDLRIDPGVNGCYSIEATNFLLYDRVIDPLSDLVLWQIGVLGDFTTEQKIKSKEIIDILLSKLLSFYDANHRAFLYEAALYPTQKPKIQEFDLENLCDQQFTSISTLFIPARKGNKINGKILKLLSK